MPIVTLPGGEVRDEIRQPLYDTVELTAGETLAGVYNFFTSLVYETGMPSAGSPKSIAKTNMTTPGQLQTAVSFRTQGLCLDASFSNSASDGTNPGGVITASKVLPIIMERGGVILNVGVKNYWQGPARFACGRMDVWGQNLGANFAAVTQANGSDATIFTQKYGWASIQPVVFQGRHVIDINPLQNFLLQLTVAEADLTAFEDALAIPAGINISLVGSLKGLLRRPVQ